MPKYSITGATMASYNLYLNGKYNSPAGLQTEINGWIDNSSLTTQEKNSIKSGVSGFMSDFMNSPAGAVSETSVQAFFAGTQQLALSTRYYSNAGQTISAITTGSGQTVWAKIDLGVPANSNPSMSVQNFAKGIGYAAVGLTVGIGLNEIWNASDPYAASVKQQAIFAASLTVGELAYTGLGSVFGGPVSAIASAAFAGGTAFALNKYWDDIISQALDLKSQNYTQEQTLQAIQNDFMQDMADDLEDAEPSDIAPFMTPFPTPLGEIGGPHYCPVPEGWMGPLQDGMDKTPTIYSPLVIDMDGDGVELTNLTTGSVYWDIDNDGMAEASAWVKEDDALLAIDLNNDGVINNHSELFGTETTDGFTILTAYDTNYDNVIDANDTDFSKLLIWQDLNQDGKSQANELKTLTQAGITSISLNDTQVNYDINGNPVTHQSTVTMNGTTKTIIDAWFNYDGVNTQYAGEVDIDVRTLFLPTLRGFGDVKDLYIQMSLDETLLEKVSDIASADAETLLDPSFDLIAKFKDVLFRWAEVHEIQSTLWTQSDDMTRKYEFLDRLMGTDIFDEGMTQGYAQIVFVDRLWVEPFNHLFADFMGQTELGKILFEGGIAYNPSLGVTENVTGLSAGGLEDIADLIDASTDPASGWANILRMIEGTIGIKNLDAIDYALLDTAIQSSLPGIDLTAFYYAIRYEIADAIDASVITNQFGIGTNGNDASITSAPYDVSTVLIGNDGDDVLSGSYKTNLMIGGDGNDTYYGSGGDDIYVYQQGNDVIYEAGNENHYDRLVFDKGIDVNDITIARINQLDPNSYEIWGMSDLVIDVDGRGSVTLKNQYMYSEDVEGVEKMEFYDGTVIDLRDLDKAIMGTSGNDTLVGLDRAYYLNDRIEAGDGNDTLNGGLGINQLKGGMGNDTYLYGGGFDLIKDDGNGNDKIVFDNTYDPNKFTFVFDPLMNAYANATMALKIYYDGVLKVVVDKQFGYGTANFVEKVVVDGVHEFDLSMMNWDQYGTNGNDSLYAIEADNVYINAVYGLGGNDTITGSHKDDWIEGGDGDDMISGNDGNDQLYGGAGNDYVNGGAGSDAYIYQGGQDTYYEGNGGSSDDLIFMDGNYALADITLVRSGQNDLQILHDGQLVITIAGQFGMYSDSSAIEWLYVPETAGPYYIDLREVHYTTNGTSAGEFLIGISYGGHPDDVLNGLGGDDYLYGYRGNDVLNGGDGTDLLTGGEGADTFLFEAATAFNNVDTVADFHTYENDKIDISDLLIGYTPGTSDINDFVSINTNGSNSDLWVDRDGAGTAYSATQIATLSNTTGLIVNDLLNNGHLIAA